MNNKNYECCIIGAGPAGLGAAYELIKKNPEVNRLNIELDLKLPLENMEETLRKEREAFEKSIEFCRKELGV